MAYRRGGFALTPPSLVIFVISVLLAIVAFLMRYAGVAIPVIGPANVFHVLAIAYLLLVVGVVFRGL